MKAQELRIGNYCRDSLTGEWLLVDEIQKGENDKHIIGFYVVNRDKFPLPDGWEAEPIPITLEILEKCGIAKQREYIGIWLLEIDIVRKIATIRDPHVHASSVEFTCKFLHQLQNLYFVFTDKELEINL